MTADWFDDLAERCGDAARYAEAYDEPSRARELRVAQQDAEDLAQAIRSLLASPELLTSPEETTAARTTVGKHVA